LDGAKKFAARGARALPTFGEDSLQQYRIGSNEATRQDPTSTI
jgi:hypothetical protein